MADAARAVEAAAIAVRGVTKIFGEGVSQTPALNGVDLDVWPGELTLMMGPSGSGKTTLLSIMGCILRPTEGVVRVAGRDVTELHEDKLPAVRLKNIGFVFQSFNLFPTLTAGENVELSLELKGMGKRATKDEARRLLELVGVSEKYDEFPRNLSGGQKQRVAVARAVAGEPQVILADEPTAALDSHSGRNVMEVLRKLAHQEHRAVVVVTHDNRVLEFGDRKVRMEDGLIAQS
jgi:putative ABC transport system ATP-binding protein